MHLTCEIRTIEGTTLGVLLVQPKTFRSCKTGYFGQGKVVLGGQRYQAQAQMVAVAAKRDPGDAEAAK